MWPHTSQFHRSSGRWYLLSYQEGQSLHFIMFLNETHSILNHIYICHSVTSNVRRMSKHTGNHLRNHNDFRFRDSSISIVWETLMTFPNHVVFSLVDRSHTLFSNMCLCDLDWYRYILWPVKHDHLSEHILVLIHCHSHGNSRLGKFRIAFLYASRFYYANHVFGNLSRITIHGGFILLYAQE